MTYLHITLSYVSMQAICETLIEPDVCCSETQVCQQNLLSVVSAVVYKANQECIPFTFLLFCCVIHVLALQRDHSLQDQVWAVFRPISLPVLEHWTFANSFSWIRRSCALYCCTLFVSTNGTHSFQYSDWVCTAVMSKWRHERSSRLIYWLIPVYLCICSPSTNLSIEIKMNSKNVHWAL